MNKEILQITKRLQQIQDTGNYTVFYSFSGHVNYFQYSIYEGKWTAETDPVLRRELKIKDGPLCSPEDYSVIIELKDIINELNSLTF